MNRKTALRFVLLLGVVSLCADVTYEGARSIMGPYLAVLGASATIVGVVAGFGELLGYGLRLVSGGLSERTGKFWPIGIVGYVIQMAAVPLLALAGSWQFAAVLIVMERVGKATRKPSMNVILSHATQEMGHGWGFGVHEALDQIGGLSGPLLVSAVLAASGSYRLAFATLLVPAILTLALVAAARFVYPRPGGMEVPPPRIGTQGLPRSYWIYLAGAALVAAGFADFSIMAFHFQKTSVVSPSWIPIFYSVSMAVSGLGSLVFGRLFDRVGIKVLAPLTLVSALAAPLAFLGDFKLAMLGTALWGFGMGVHESIIPAAIASLVPIERRPSAYGLFTAAYGVSWFLGSALIGHLYDVSLSAVILFSVAVEMLAVPFFLKAARE
ncbi:MAG: MFS transporter [Bryobacteraceae bacterium]